MPKPRADFECKPCGAKAGTGPVVHENLPVTSVFCPYTGKRRGFKRLFNKVQVSTSGHRVARFIDKRLQPQYDKHAAVTGGAKDFEKAGQEAMDKAYEMAPPKVRAEMAGAKKQGFGAKVVPVARAWSAIDPGARADSRAHTWPMLQRRAVPDYRAAG